VRDRRAVRNRRSAAIVRLMSLRVAVLTCRQDYVAYQYEIAVVPNVWSIITATMQRKAAKKATARIDLACLGRALPSGLFIRLYPLVVGDFSCGTNYPAIIRFHRSLALDSGCHLRLSAKL
jgi:hypothetical protein